MARDLAAKIAVLLCVSGIVAPGANLPALPSWSHGDAAYRQADFEAAESFYRSALSADPACARALWGLGRIAELHFRRGAARDYFAAAFRLDPRDPQIIKSYASVVPDRESQTILWKNYIAVGAAGRQDLESALGRIQMYQQLGDREVDALASPYRAYALPMKPYYPASARPAGMVLSVSVNGGKPLRLIFDSGAKGILIRAKAAEKLGLEFVGDSLVRGPGSGVPASARVALAESLQINELRMRNCLLEVTDSIPAGDADGVIGARMFQRFLIRFDARQRLLELLPFPDRETGAQTHAIQVGHLLLVRARVNAERFGYFVLDTGAAFSALSLDLARSRGQVAAPMYGLDGRVGDAVRISPVQFHFAGEPLTDVDPIAFDLREISRQEGVEISGLIGYPALSRGVLTIDYRDGLIDISPDFRAATRR